MTPFWNAQTTYWESAEVTGTAKFGYTYPEFNGLDLGDKQAVKRAITQKINELYGFDASDFSAASVAAPPPAQQQTLTRDVSLTTPAYLDWTARVHVKKYEIGGSFSILLFVGAVPADPAEWHAAPSFAGAYSGFVNSASDRCANCRGQRAAGVVLEGFVHLNNAIRRKVDSFAVDVVEPLLKEQLHWRILKVRLPLHYTKDSRSYIYSIGVGRGCRSQRRPVARDLRLPPRDGRAALPGPHHSADPRRAAVPPPHHARPSRRR